MPECASASHLREAHDGRILQRCHNGNGLRITTESRKRALHNSHLPLECFDLGDQLTRVAQTHRSLVLPWLFRVQLNDRFAHLISASVNSSPTLLASRNPVPG